ncbi:MAG: HAD-IC family P-type ATPase [bacterium]|nr:HAD-IC family P-type ATPase [bacterium]
MEQQPWHSLTAEKTAELLSTDIETGLSLQEVVLRRKEFGENRLPEEKAPSRLLIFAKQFRSPLILILVAAGAVTLVLGEHTDSAVIFGAVVLNTFIGYFQENKASQTLAALKKVLRVRALVFRGGKEHEVAEADLVPGDLVKLAPGSKAPADGRVVASSGLEINEAVLTGEWISSVKSAEPISQDTPLADRDSMAYQGSVVTEGEGMMLVTATGATTELGTIAQLVQRAKEEETPYQARLKRFSWLIGGIVGILAILIFAIGIVKGGDFLEMFTTAVAVAVAAVPEGLPVAITVVLAIGMRRILAERGLVRHLTSAETLGSTSVIATDKTLTLTEGKMRMEELELGSGVARDEALSVAALANEAFAEEVKGSVILRGRPTDKALLETAMEEGIVPEELILDFPLLRRVPFNTKNKYVASFHQHGKNILLAVAGAPESVIAASRLTKLEAEEAHKRLEAMAGRGLRVVALAKREIRGKTLDPSQEISRLTLLGFAGFKDPLRPGVKEAILAARLAGVRTVIVTGDHALTAKSVALELGMEVEDGGLMEGRELDTVSDEDLDMRLERVVVFARVEPAHKLRIIEAWQRKGEVIAMTGDGVNDAPALKRADIGIALGSATDVAKESSDLVLLDDNFQVISSAIREGRVILDNAQKAITFLLSGSFSETLLIGSALFFGLPLPVTAIQILWINIVESGLPGIALTFEKMEGDVMSRPPQKKDGELLNPEMKVIIFAVSIFTDILLILVFLGLLSTTYSIEHIRTFLFAALATDSLLYAFSCKSLRRNIWEYSLFSNRYLNMALAGSFALLLGTIYLPFFQNLFHTVALNAIDWGVLALIAFLNVLLIEGAKWYFIKKRAPSLSGS